MVTHKKFYMNIQKSTFDSHLSFNAHVDTITKKANSTQARNKSQALQSQDQGICIQHIRKTNSWVPSFVLDTHTQCSSKKMEQVQRNAAGFVTGIYDRTRSVSAILQELTGNPYRTDALAVTWLWCTRIYYGLINIEWNQYLIHLSTSTKGHKSHFVISHTKSTVLTNSFFPVPSGTGIA